MLFLFQLALAQEFPIYPELPAKAEFRQIETDMFRLIYPELTSEVAFELADMLEHYTPQIRLEGHRPIDIVVQPYMATSNAFVAFMPRRSLFFTMPYMSTDPSKMGTSLSWNLALSIHEMQHVEQQDRVYHTGGMGAFVLSGELGWGLITAISQPIWFVEGEAVMTETLLSPSGRGRTFGFIGSSIALYDHGEPLSYPQSVFGSFKKNIPDHYRIGWLMTDYGYQRYGEAFWPQISRMATSNAFRFYPFEKALLTMTGQKFQEWHDHSIQSVLDSWTMANTNQSSSVISVLYEDQSPFPNYLNSPITTSKETIVALRSGYEQINDIVEIQNGEIERIISIGQRNGTNIAADNRFIVWDAFVDHPLHNGLRYSDLFVFDHTDNKAQRMTRRGYYFSPAIGPEHRLVAIKNQPNGQSSLAFFDLNNPHKLPHTPDKVVSAPAGVLYDPHWETDKHLLLIRREVTKGNILCRYHIDTEQFEDIGQWSWTPLSHPTSNENWIFVVESQSYSDDVVAIPKSGGNIRTAAHRPYGLRDPHYDRTTNQLIMTEVTHKGSKLIAMDIEPENWPERQSSIPETTLNIPTNEWQSRPYYAVLGILRPYSWLPTISLAQSNISLEVSAIDPTARWSLTQNVQYNINRQGIWGQTAISATRPWPNLTIESQYGRRSERDLNQIPSEPSADFRLSDLPTQEWREHSVQVGMDFPVSWSSSSRKRILTLELNGGIQNADQLVLLNGQQTDTIEIPLGISFPLQGRLTLQHQRIPSVLDLFPRIGVSVESGHTHLLAEDNSQNSYVSTQMFFPGVWPHHHLLLYGAIEERLGPYPLPYQSRLARGHQTTSEQLLNFSLGYAFPIAYPDFAVKRFLFIKRIRSGGFIDAMWDGESHMTQGINLTMDVHLMRLPILIPIGVDIGRTIETNDLYIGPSIDILY